MITKDFPNLIKYISTSVFANKMKKTFMGTCPWRCKHRKYIVYVWCLKTYDHTLRKRVTKCKVDIKL
jgi:hypothetical protein